MKKNKIPEKLSPALLTIEQTCQLLNVSRAEFYRLKAKGKIGPQPVGLSRKYLYRKDEIENWIKAGLPNKDIWRIIMKKEQDYKNNVNININNFNGVLGNVQSENLQNENNTNCNNFKNNKDVLKNRNIAQALFTFIKKSIGFLGLIKSFILKLL
ncbi:MAG: helix-turn-helix domain-containing protein [Sedimentisphaerales bacterium]|nr:helix-turn-helix domain-containing protein [Sedimentisphaerales bacterium]